MVVTKEIIESGKSINGGYSLSQLKCFGFDGFNKGWKKSVIGKDIEDELVKKFINLKNAHIVKSK